MSQIWITFTSSKTTMNQIARIVLLASLALWNSRCGEVKSPGDSAPEHVSDTLANATAESASGQVNQAEALGESTSVEATPAPSPVVSADSSRLAGTWERTDAPYQLVITDIKDDGSMTAIYLNPNPVNVSKSNWVDGKDVMSIFVELRDVNYPGSNYSLTYFPDRDMLIGKYFQAVRGMTYDVAFARAK
jgi:hypothetical protein